MKRNVPPRESFLEKGDIIEIKKGHTVYANIPEHFVYSNKRGVFKITHTKIKLNEQFDYLIGKYIVTHTTMDGGSTGRDAYPNGHHVYCVKADNPSIEIDFYQSGCFTAMIKDIKSIGRANQIWSIK